ncbi:uncharacterized protein LOC120074622 [Benincasa hispida]|uniref:uncharacterized protein LOC120074622 n=1 Tax=Benincasa hispida TaxID=102211 RepID=UPI001900C8DF|nr:uncharacterized protein LOC120074622 [Benincasa hispida]
MSPIILLEFLRITRLFSWSCSRLFKETFVFKIVVGVVRWNIKRIILEAWESIKVLLGKEKISLLGFFGFNFEIRVRTCRRMTSGVRDRATGISQCFRSCFQDLYFLKFLVLMFELEVLVFVLLNFL